MTPADFRQVVDSLIKFRNDRDWEQYHTPKNLASAISVEAGELLECFLWQEEPTKDIRQEIADIFIFLAYLCHDTNIDLLQAVREKIKINEKKYPINKAKGNCRKYDEL